MHSLDAAGLQLEVDSSGAWPGFQAGREDPIADDPDHPIWGPEWSPVAATGAMLVRVRKSVGLHPVGGMACTVVSALGTGLCLVWFLGE